MTFPATYRGLLIATLLFTPNGCKKAGTPSATSQPATPVELRIAAASDLQFALADLLSSFESLHPDIHVSVTYGSSGNLYSQLANKAPFDVFLSADATYPQKLVDQKLAARSAVFPYATGHTVVWAAKDSTIDLKSRGLNALLEPRVKKIAIANPDHAPYGRAAVAALKSANLYDRVKDRLVFGENISQTAQFAASGSADVGVIALSLALAPQMQGKGTYWEIPTDSYPQIQQAGVILNSSADLRAAETFRDYLTSEAGRSTLARCGFSPPAK